MNFARATLLSSLFLLAGCSAGGHTFTDGGGDSAESGVCQSGQYYCVGSIAHLCDGHGGTVSTQDCSAVGLNCFQTIGCRMCMPSENRCDPSNPMQTQQCATDGSGWLNGPLCDENMGQQCSAGICQDRCNDPTHPSYLGCEYWPTVTANSQLVAGFDYSVVVANPETYPVHFNITGGALTAPIDQNLMPGEVQTINLPWVPALSQHNRMGGIDCPQQVCVATSVLAQNGAYHIQANGPIAAYQFNPLEYQAAGMFSYTVDASLLLPTNVLTQHYTVVTHDNWDAPDAFGTTVATLGGFVAIVGVSPIETGTNVTVRLTAAISGGPGVMAAGPSTQTYNLRQGDVVQLVASQSHQDLSGTIIEADQPVAVFTGHDCTNMPANNPACDHLEEQLFPNETWGHHYAVSQLRDRTPTEQSVIRIMSDRAGLSLTFDGIPTPSSCNRQLDAGQFCEFQTASSFQVMGTQPMLVMQYMIGEGPATPQCAPPPPDLPACEGDPAMVTEVPVEQFRTSYDFLVPSTYTRQFVNVVSPAGVSVSLDGVALSGSTAPVGTGYQVQFVPLMAGAHHIESTQPFGIKVYGIAQYTSYMYPGGLDLAQIAPPG